MADEKAKIVTDATGPSSGPAPAQPEVDAQVSKQEQSAPEAPTPDKAEAPAQEAPAQDKAADAPKEQKAASVSVFNFSEIMAEKKATERAAAQQEAKAPDKGTSPTPTKEDGPKQEKSKEQEQAPKRRGRPPKADKYKAAAPAQKEAPSKKDKAVQKSAQPGKTEKAAPSEKTEKAPKAPSPAIPNIIIRKTKPLGHYGRLRKAYLEMHRPILFNELVLSDKLFEHCAEIDEAARNRMELIVPELVKRNGVTEQLKAENQMEWVRQMNACKAQAEEVVKAELIYD